MSLGPESQLLQLTSLYIIFKTVFFNPVQCNVRRNNPSFTCLFWWALIAVLSFTTLSAVLIENLRFDYGNINDNATNQ